MTGQTETILQLGRERPPCHKAEQMQRFTRPRAMTWEQGRGQVGQGLFLQGQGLENCP